MDTENFFLIGLCRLDRHAHVLIYFLIVRYIAKLEMLTNTSFV